MEHEQQQRRAPRNLADAWGEFVLEKAVLTEAPERLHDLKSCFYAGAMSLMAIVAAAGEAGDPDESDDAAKRALDTCYAEICAHFENEPQAGDVVTLQVMEVNAATADELVAKVREVVPLTPEHEAEIRAMHAKREQEQADAASKH